MSVMLSYVCIPALLYHVYIHDRFHLISQYIAHQQLFKTRLSYIVSEFSLIKRFVHFVCMLSCLMFLEDVFIFDVSWKLKIEERSNAFHRSILFCLECGNLEQRLVTLDFHEHSVKISS